MSTLKQQEASRANGAKSRGPSTPEGKSIASKNSITHGLYARQIVIPGESPEAYDTHVQGFLHQFQPINTYELDLVRDLAAAEWQLQRARAIENQLLREAILNVSGPGTPLICEMTAGFASASASPVFENIERHQIRLTRLYNRALTSLFKCRKDRPPAAPPEVPGENPQSEPKPFFPDAGQMLPQAWIDKLQRKNLIPNPIAPEPEPSDIQAGPTPQNTQNEPEPQLQPEPEPAPSPEPAAIPAELTPQNTRNEPEPEPQPEPKFIHPAIVNGHPTFYAVKDESQPGGLRFIHPEEATEIANSRS